MRYFIRVILIVFSTFLSVACSTGREPRERNDSKPYIGNVKEIEHRITKHNLNKQYMFVVDYGKHSGHKRFYIVDLKKKNYIKAMMVAHGSGSETGRAGYASTFSNTPESYQSSLGYVIVAQRGYSKYGIHVKYVLKGISRRNSNMEKRVIVLHSYTGFPTNATYPKPMVNSWGCTTVSDETMRYLDRFIQRQKNKRILMHIRQ